MSLNLVDGIAFNSIKDTDGDQQADHLDLDSDNDGVKDLVQAGGADIDGDGQVDTWLDSDSDGIPNTVDVDFTLSSKLIATAMVSLTLRMLIFKAMVLSR